MNVASRKSQSVLLGFILTAAGAVAQAQAARETVPVELVNALFGTEGRAPKTQYFVGTTPPGWPAALVPTSPARTLGGTRTARELVAVFVDSSSHDLVDTYDRMFVNAGFVHPSSSAFGFQTGGFQESEGRYSLWCGDSSQLSAMARSSDRGVTYLTVRYAPAMRRSMCSGRGAPPTDQERDHRFATLALPRLYAPPGVTAGRSGTSGGGNTITASTELDSTSMTPTAVLQHYSAQLVKAGWTALSTSSSTPFASQLYEARDELKRTWHGVLLVTPIGPRRDVTLMMARPSDDDGIGSSSYESLRQER